MSVLADELQLWGFEGDFILYSDGSYGFGLDLSLADVSTWNDADVDALAGRLCTFLNGLPDNIDIQFFQEIRSGNDDIFVKNQNLGAVEINPTVAALNERRITHLRESDELGFIPRQDLKLFVRRKPFKALFPKPGIFLFESFHKERKFQSVAENTLIRELAATKQLREELVRSLSSTGITATPIDERHIAELVYRQWNPSRPIGLGEYDPEDIRSSLLFSDAAIYDTGFSMGGIHQRVISLKLLPEQTYSSMAIALRELPFNSRLFLSIHVPEQQKELESLQTQRRLAFSMARGKRSGVSDIESETKLQDLEALLNEMVAQGEKVFHFSLNIVLRSNDETDLREQVSQTLAKVRELGGEAMEETLAAFDIFTEFSIPHARANERSKRIKTSNLADFLPLYGPWQGHRTPRVLLKSSVGSLMGFDPFSQELTNFNQIVTGGSGSGKSFLTNLLLLQMLKENPLVFIVDIGGSYKKLSDNLNGQYIHFSLDSHLSINPFELAEGESSPSDHKIKFLVGLVEMMTKENGEAGLKRLERSEIEDAIHQVYRTVKYPKLSDLRSVLSESQSPELVRLGKILLSWCGETPFGRLMDRSTTISLERPLVCFDLKGLESYPDLQAIALYLITDYVWREVQKDKGRLKFLVLDECWKLLENDSGCAFIKEVFRTFRKYFASCIGISQNIDDFARSKIATAILPNTAIKWVLKQKGADQVRLKEVLQLNEKEMALIASLHQERGAYSQAFLMVEDKHCLVSVEPTPLEYWVATSDARDIAAFEESIRENPGKAQLEVLRELSEKYPSGIAAGEETK